MSETRERDTVLKTPPLPTKPIKLSRDKSISENYIEEDNRKYALKHGCLFDKFTSPSKRSVPDRMLTCPEGLIAFIEYKAPGKKPTPKQWQDHVERRGRGVLVYVVDDIALGRQLIDDLVALDKTRVERKSWYVDEEVIRTRAFYHNINRVEV